jgi:hypothetical protein
MATKKEIIQKKALEILDANPKGIRYSELVAKILEAVPDRVMEPPRSPSTPLLPS